MFFLDTSALVKPYLREIGAETVRSLIADAEEEIYISTHVALEVVATFAYKLRDRQVNGRTYRRIRRDFLADMPGSLQLAPVDEAAVLRAMHLADQHPVVQCRERRSDPHRNSGATRQNRGTLPTIICADRAMRNLAAAAGFGVFNPETDDPITLAG